MEASMIEKSEMVLIGLAIDVTLSEVQHENRPTYSLAAEFMRRRAEIELCINDKEVFGLSTEPGQLRPGNRQV